MTQKDKPVDKIRFGRIEAAIWKNQSEKGAFYSVTVSRTYKDAAGDLKSSDSFSGSDLLVAAQALEVAYRRTRELAAT